MLAVTRLSGPLWCVWSKRARFLPWRLSLEGMVATGRKFGAKLSILLLSGAFIQDFKLSQVKFPLKVILFILIFS